MTEAAARESERRSQRERFARATLDALTAHICILDETGTIIAINESWRAFAQANQLSAEQAGVGVSYLAVCDAATGPDAHIAAAFAAGIRAVMRGEADQFGLEYPCHSPAEQRWFFGRVTHFAGQGPRCLVVAHENVTKRKQAEEALHVLSGQLLRSQDEERRRIARELHDTTAQALTALLMNLSLVNESAPGINDKTRQLLAGAIALAEQCARELRTVSYLLHPPMLDELGLAGAMRDYADGFARRSGLRIDLELPPDLERLPHDTELALFRIMQEALTNVRRHSHSRTASIRLARTATELRLELRDQGRGMAAAGRPPAGHSPGGTLGVGVAGMRERMRQLGGRLEITSNDHGTCVIAVAPAAAQTPPLLRP